MRTFVRSSILGVLALALAAVPVLAQEQEMDLEKFVGNYEFESPDLGLVSITVTLTDEGELTLSAMDSPPMPLIHLHGNSYEGESPEFGVITFGFVEDDDGAVTMMTIDGYDFSFVAEKKG